MTTDEKKMHYDLTNVGLRAQATAAGLVQLCKELHSAGMLGDDAVGRIKSAVADEITLNAPRSRRPDEFRRDTMERLDRLFAGKQRVGDASGVAFPAADHVD